MMVGINTKIKKLIAGSECGRFPSNIIFDEEASKILDEQSGVSKSSNTKRNRKTLGSFGMPNDKTPEYSDKGGASRFFYCAKTNKKDRNEGLEHLEGKPMAWSNLNANSSDLEKR